MPANPKKCRKSVLRCAEPATKARTEKLKALLLELPKNWEHVTLTWSMSCKGELLIISRPRCFARQTVAYRIAQLDLVSRAHWFRTISEQ
jgi:hypothetical protein